MSVDMLLTASGRLASLARNSSTQARVAGDEQDGGSDPATLFGALLEKPHGKVDASGKDEAEAKSDEKEAGDGSGQKPVAVFGLPQNLLSLASALPGQQHGEGAFLWKKRRETRRVQPFQNREWWMLLIPLELIRRQQNLRAMMKNGPSVSCRA